VKRRVALLFAAAVLLLVAASLLVARTAWVGDALCRGLAERIRAETGQPFHAESCRVAPLRLAVEARGLRVGPPEAPLFQAEAVWLRLAPLQALPLIGITEDAPRNQPGNLDNPQPAAIGQLEREGLAFIVETGLVQIGVQESTRNVGYAPNAAVGGGAVHMHIKYIHED